MANTREGLSTRGNLSYQDFLEALPKNEMWFYGRAIGEGDCFYDCIAQSLYCLNPNKTYTVKQLRKICSNYMRQLDGENPEKNWVKTAIENTKYILDDYPSHLATVQYTQSEMEELAKSNFFTGRAIWGKTEVEGRILAKLLNIKMHVIEFPDYEDYEGKEKVSPGHVLVTADHTKTLEGSDVNYNDERTVHLAVYRDHFVPILPNPMRELQNACTKYKNYLESAQKENWIVLRSTQLQSKIDALKECQAKLTDESTEDVYLKLKNFAETFATKKDIFEANAERGTIKFLKAIGRILLTVLSLGYYNLSRKKALQENKIPLSYFWKSKKEWQNVQCVNAIQQHVNKIQRF